MRLHTPTMYIGIIPSTLVHYTEIKLVDEIHGSKLQKTPRSTYLKVQAKLSKIWAKFGTKFREKMLKTQGLTLGLPNITRMSRVVSMDTFAICPWALLLKPALLHPF